MVFWHHCFMPLIDTQIKQGLMQPMLEPLGLSSRALLYKAFSLQDCREENRADLVKGSVGEGDQDRFDWTWRCYHYHALQFLHSLQFVSDTNYQSEIA